MGGGGGGGDDYSAKQAQIEANKARSRNALNVLFGVAPTMPEKGAYQQALPKDKRFFNKITGMFGPDWVQRGDMLGYSLGAPDQQYGLNPTSYGGAYQIAQGQVAEAEKNKAARDLMYQKIRDEAFGAGKRGFDERRDTAKRQNKFALFAQGLAGGSEDVDQNAMLQRAYNEGVLQLGAKADSAKTDMMSSDEQTRLGLLQSIDAGMDEASAVSSALGQLKVNSDRAAAQAQGTTLGDLFADAGLLYTQSQAAKGRNSARGSFANLFPTYARPAGTSRNAGAGGTITGTGGP